MAELRTSGSVTRLAIRYINGGATEAESGRFEVGKLVLVDVKSKKKHFPIKDANGQFGGGPLGDSIDGGRILVTIPPGRTGVLFWANAVEAVVAASRTMQSDAAPRIRCAWVNSFDMAPSFDVMGKAGRKTRLRQSCLSARSLTLRASGDTSESVG